MALFDQLRPTFTATLGVGLVLLLGACSSPDDAPVGCSVGYVACGAVCVPAGTCQGVGTGGATGTGGGTGNGPATGPCSDTATDTGSFSGAIGDASLWVATGKSYKIIPNWWGNYSGQTVTFSGLSFTIQGNTPADGDFEPAGYPTMYIGSYSGKASALSNLPKQVAQITSIPSVLETNALTLDTSDFNTTYDVWFTATGTALPTDAYNPGPGGAYLMVWLYDPARQQPRGSRRETKPVTNVPGTWDVWVDNSNPPCISYVSSSPRTGLDFDLNNFIRDAVVNGFGITDSMYLSVVFAGFEVWSGAQGASVERFCVDVR